MTRTVAGATPTSAAAWRSESSCRSTSA